jgi:hypothetical protein
MRRTIVWGLLACSVLMSAAAVQEKPLRNPVRLVNDSDLYCSFLALEEVPTLRIKAAERAEERALLTQGDLFVFDRRPSDGLAEGQRLAILEISEAIKPAASGARPVTVAFQRGTARVALLDSKTARARIERSCGPIEIGQVLVPFEERKPFFGFDEGYAGSERKAEGPQGKVLYLGKDVLQAASGQWALVDLGTGQGVDFGRQLTVFRKPSPNAVWQGVATLVVVQSGPRVSTVKILSARDAVQLGDIVQLR